MDTLKGCYNSPLGATIKRILGARYGKAIIKSLYTAKLPSDTVIWSNSSIMGGIWWDSTPQGCYYWSKVYASCNSKGLVNFLY